MTAAYSNGGLSIACKATFDRPKKNEAQFSRKLSLSRYKKKKKPNCGAAIWTAIIGPGSGWPNLRTGNPPPQHCIPKGIVSVSAFLPFCLLDSAVFSWLNLETMPLKCKKMTIWKIFSTKKNSFHLIFKLDISTAGFWYFHRVVILGLNSVHLGLFPKYMPYMYLRILCLGTSFLHQHAAPSACLLTCLFRFARLSFTASSQLCALR